METRGTKEQTETQKMSNKSETTQKTQKITKANKTNKNIHNEAQKGGPWAGMLTQAKLGYTVQPQNRYCFL